MNAKHLFTPIRFSQIIAKPRSKPLALGVDVVRPQWRAASTGISIISFPESSQAILLKLPDARKLLTVAVNTSLQTLNQLPNLIDDRGCEDVPAVAGMYTDYAFPLCHILKKKWHADSGLYLYYIDAVISPVSAESKPNI